MNFSDVIEQEYQQVLNTPGDINEHLELLYELACECDHVTEFGSRFGDSTKAFLRAPCKLRAYDLEMHPPLQNLFNLAELDGKDVKYRRGNTLTLLIEPTDMIFIDTWHSKEQLQKELKLHGNTPKKYLAFHDTHTYGVRDEDKEWWKNPDRKAIKGQGLLPAVIEFVIANPHWKFKTHRTNNNGLTVLERVE